MLKEKLWKFGSCFKKQDTFGNLYD
jgi:hypothetical protein